MWNKVFCSLCDISLILWSHRSLALQPKWKWNNTKNVISFSISRDSPFSFVFGFSISIFRFFFSFFSCRIWLGEFDDSQVIFRLHDIAHWLSRNQHTFDRRYHHDAFDTNFGDLYLRYRLRLRSVARHHEKWPSLFVAVAPVEWCSFVGLFDAIRCGFGNGDALCHIAWLANWHLPQTTQRFGRIQHFCISRYSFGDSSNRNWSVHLFDRLESLRGNASRRETAKRTEFDGANCLNSITEPSTNWTFMIRNDIIIYVFLHLRI